MRGIGLLGCGVLILGVAGCEAVAPLPPLKIEEIAEKPGFVPLPQEDSLEPSRPKDAAAALPMGPITRCWGDKLDDLTLERLRRYDRDAWLAYNKDIQALHGGDGDVFHDEAEEASAQDARQPSVRPSTDGDDVFHDEAGEASAQDARQPSVRPSTDDDRVQRDRICRRALEALVAAMVRQSGTPLSEEHILRGLELVEASGTREHRFAIPDDGIRERARRRRDTAEGKLVLLYVGRYDLYHNFLLDGLKGCGLTPSDVYWTPAFTMLDLELRGLEERYLKIVDSPDWK